MFDVNKPIEYVITSNPYAAKYLGTCNRTYRHVVLVERVCGGQDEVRFCNDKGEVDSPGKGCKVRNVPEKKKFYTVTYRDNCGIAAEALPGQDYQSIKVGSTYRNGIVIGITEGEYTV